MGSETGATASKQAACLNCRKSKIKCKRSPGESVCVKCDSSDIECVIPSFHIGRQKGVKNKRTGLDKAIYQIEEAIKKSRSDTVANEGTLQQLQQLLDEARGALPESTSTADPNSPDHGISIADRDGAGLSSDDQFTLHDAENPLQLLARASDLRLNMSDPHASTPSTGKISSSSNDPLDIHRFFLPIKAKPDLGPDLDPIDIGLVSLEEADRLLIFFHENLAHTRWGLDPLVHTLDFVRSRSAFLFTALLLASARFMPSAAALAKRLLLHRQFLVQQIIGRRCRSVEIVLAFMVSVPWMHPLEHSADDDTGVFISIALSLALDLSLNKIITPSWSFDQDLLSRLPKADCIDAKRALAMDGFEDVEVRSEWGQRLLRRRERVWIALFVLERGVCLARGRSYCLPITPLVKYCDRWHTYHVSDPQDGPLVSMAVLRRDLDDLLAAIRQRCDCYRVIDVGDKVAREIESMIDEFFHNWLARWTTAIGEGPQNQLPPYVEILVTHTRLSTYSGVINHPTAPLEVKRQFRASALSAALNVMRAAIQGESRLVSMPNNTVIMICFAACVALNLSTPSRRANHNLAPSVRSLIEETATVLERIGSTPPHRNGASVIYGKYLREIVRQAPNIELSLPADAYPNPHPHTANTHHHRLSQASMAAVDTTTNQSTLQINSTSYTTDPQLQNYGQVGGQVMGPAWGPAGPGGGADQQPFHFSAMSSNQLTEAIMNAGDFESALFDFPMDENIMGWMDWGNPPEFGFQ